MIELYDMWLPQTVAETAARGLYNDRGINAQLQHETHGWDDADRSLVELYSIRAEEYVIDTDRRGSKRTLTQKDIAAAEIYIQGIVYAFKSLAGGF